MIITVWVLTAIFLASCGFGVLEIIGLLFLLHFGALFVSRVWLAVAIRRLVS